VGVFGRAVSIRFATPSRLAAHLRGDSLNLFEGRIMLNPLVQDTDGKAISRVVAEVFGKEHFHVLRDIQNLECPQDFRKSNFGCTSYEVPGTNGAVRKAPITNDEEDEPDEAAGMLSLGLLK